MKRSLLYLFIVLAIFIASCSGGNHIKHNAFVGSSVTLKVMTYNVHHCNPPSKSLTDDVDIDTIVAVIKNQNPDLVALQEIDDHTRRAGAFNEADEIAKKLKMNYYFGKAIDYEGGGYGVAILSKYPLSEVKTFPLPTTEGFKGEKRVFASAKIVLSNGKVIRFGCTHLDASNQANRVLQVTEINRVTAAESLPFIIGGDFNAEAGSKTINALDGSFTRSCITGCGFTIPAVNPTKTIDFIVYRPADKFTVLEHRVIDEKYASDHLPVLVVLKINSVR